MLVYYSHCYPLGPCEELHAQLLSYVQTDALTNFRLQFAMLLATQLANRRPFNIELDLNWPSNFRKIMLPGCRRTQLEDAKPTTACLTLASLQMIVYSLL